MRWTWQNLSKDPKGRSRGFAWHGRAWLHLDELRALRVEWSLHPELGAGARLAVLDGDDTLKAHVRTPLLGLFFGLATDPRERLAKVLQALVGPTDISEKYGARELNVYLQGATLVWKLWVDPGGWTNTRPRWRHGSIDFADAVLGKAVYSSASLETVDIVVPMPEGSYAGVCTLTEDTWKRPRWFARRVARAKVDMRDPIPIPGKGENSWDCGEDAVHGLTTPARSVAEGIAAVVGSALRTRERRAGIGYVPERRRTA